MKNRINLILICIVFSCTEPSEKKNNPVEPGESSNIAGVEIIKPDSIKNPVSNNEAKSPKIYSNTRFRKVTLEKLPDDSVLIKGEAQIFEASFSWIIEDGHDEIAKGYTMTDAGAPEWGKFNFKIKLPEKPLNRTLHLILFEISARDGSRQHELGLPLPL